MNKAEEIAIIAETATRLGKNSYCGRWLAEQLPQIERSVQGDCFPDAFALSVTEAQNRVNEMIATAKADAAQIKGRAEKEAADLRRVANEHVAAYKAHARRAMQEALDRI